jgi:hypothetical protein
MIRDILARFRVKAIALYRSVFGFPPDRVVLAHCGQFVCHKTANVAGEGTCSCTCPVCIVTNLYSTAPATKRN